METGLVKADLLVLLETMYNCSCAVMALSFHVVSASAALQTISEILLQSLRSFALT